MSKVIKKRSGTGIGMILFIVFLVLKLTETIDWSWWWVTAPLWIPIVLTFTLLLIGFIAAIFGAATISSRKRK